MRVLAVSRRLAVAIALGFVASVAAAQGIGPMGVVPAVPQAAFQRVEIASFETKGLFSSEPVMITGYVLEAGAPGKSPAAVFAPACGGLMAPNGQIIRPWYRQMALRLRRMGITTVLIDGFNPRGRKEICSENPRQRTIDTETRMKDSLAALKYLRGRRDIDGDTIFLFTWGAAGGFRTMVRGAPESANLKPGFKAAVMLYPRCDGQDHPFDAYAPIAVFIGAEDTWNPPGPCLTLTKTKKAGSAPIEVQLYDGAYHGFDHPQPPRRIEHINDAMGPVMLGGNPAAREDTYRRVTRFVSQFVVRKMPGAASINAPGRAAHEHP